MKQGIGAKRLTKITVLLLLLIFALGSSALRVSSEEWDWSSFFSEFGFDLDGGEEEEAVEEELPSPAPGIPGGYRLIAQKGDVELYTLDKNGIVAIRNNRTGDVWLTHPDEDLDNIGVRGLERENMESPFIITFSEKNRAKIRDSNIIREDAVVTFEEIDDGIVYSFSMESVGIDVSLRYELLEDGTFKVTIPQESIKEYGDYYMTALTILPYFGAQTDQDEGYLFFPDGSGAITRFREVHPNHKSGYTEPIYGPNHFPHENGLKTLIFAQAPVFGIVSGDAAFLAIIEDGAYDANINAFPSGYMIPINRANVQFTYRRPYKAQIRRDTSVENIEQKVINGERSILYKMLHGEAAGYPGMAAAYRDYLYEKGYLRNYLEGEDRSVPLQLRVFMGIYKNELLSSRVITASTFYQVKSMLSDLVKRGVEAIDVTLAGWQHKGYEQSYPLRLPPDKAYGGAEGLKDLTKWAKEQDADIRIYLEDDYTFALNNRKGYSGRRDVIREPSRVPHIIGYFYAYILKPSVSMRIAKKDLPVIKSYGVDGIEFKGFGDFLISDSADQFSLGREATAKGWREIMKYARELGLDVRVQRGNIWTFSESSGVSELPMHGSKYFYEDESVPFLQMVLHGSVLYFNQPANLHYNKDRQFLAEVEYGSLPFYEVTYKDPEILVRTSYNRLYTGRFNDWVDSIVERYKRVNTDIGRSLLYQRMVDHEKIDEGVYCTTYESGTKVYVNYNESPYTIDGLTIGALDFLID